MMKTMSKQLIALLLGNLRMILRDHLLIAVLGVAAVMLLLVPSLSAFSMQQVQEVAITLSLSSISLVLLVLSLLLGSSAVWRDVERRYTASVLSLPLSRATYLLAKFGSIALFLGACGAILAVVSAIVIPLAAAVRPSELPIAWGTIILAVAADVLKYMLLSAVAVLLSAISTSFYLPFFGTLAIYLAGSASQEVFEYVSGQYGQELQPLAVAAIKAVYYLLPNFAAFDFKIHAVYSLSVSAQAVLLPFFYAVTYTSILLGLAVWVFNRRELS